MTKRYTKASLLAGTFIAGAMVATPAMAQDDPTNQEGSLQATPDIDADDDYDLITVTGSRIQTREVVTSAPIAVVQDEEFKLSGTVNVENVVNTLPQVIPGFTSNSNNPGTGAATLNLRGLGSTRTLVLVNDKRWMFYDTNQVVDLNTIPAFLLDSVDVVTGGASAVYGSDALAGVVNFRLRDVEGVELGGQYSITERGDGARYEVFGAIGTSFDDNRGSATVFAEYYNRESIFQGDREFSNFALGGETSSAPLQQFGSSTLPSGVLRYFGGAQGTGPQRLRDNPNTPAVEPTDNGIGAFFNNNAVVFDNPQTFRARTGDTYNYAPANYLQIPQERYLIGGYADYEAAPGVELYTEVAFVNNRVAQELAATPVTGTFSVDLATVQPFLSAASFSNLQQIDAVETQRNAANGDADDPGVVDLFIQRRVTETGSRNSLDERNAFRVLGGVRGAITDWLNYDAYYMYARTRNANVQAGNISRSAFQAGLDGTADPINIFGPNTLTPAQVDAISIQAQNGDISTLEVANAALSGNLGSFLFTGDIGFALGVEYREVGSQFLPDTALASGDVIGFNAGSPTAGSYHVQEVFGEVLVPILDEATTGMRLEASAKGRYSDYSLEAVGEVGTYAFGVEFAPIPDVTLRAQYQRAIRAPNVGELFGGQAIGFPAATDPCATAGAATNTALRQLCINNGVPAGNVGSTAIQLNNQIPALFGGNPNLEEEVSDSYTFGAVVQPRFIPGLSLTADYFNIKIEDAISTISLQQSFDLCFNQVQDAASTVCAPFFANGPSRNAAGAITADLNPPLLGGQNIAELVVSGIDVGASYNTTLPFSVWGDTGEQRLNIGFLGTWTEESSFLAFPGADLVDCAGLFGTTCGNPTPEYKFTSRFSFIDGPVTTSIRWRYLSGTTDDDDGVDYTQFNGIEEIEDYNLWDLAFAYDITEEFTFSFGVNNIFDTLPGSPEFNGIEVSNRPNSFLLGDNQEQANTYPSTFDVLGRDFFASVRFQF